jgi:hypothetical protein
MLSENRGKLITKDQYQQLYSVSDRWKRPLYWLIQAINSDDKPSSTLESRQIVDIERAKMLREKSNQT